MNLSSIQYISDCFIKPKYTTQESTQPVSLAPWDLVMLQVLYMQKGFLFAKPPNFDIDQSSLKNLLKKLKESLSVALVHFYTLSGRLATLKQEDDPHHTYSVFIDCVNSPGARFIHASLSLAVSDILSPPDVPDIVQSLFDHKGAINHDGHTLSLLTIQVTELVDGIFVGCSMNHAVADGTSFWHFLNSWSEIFNGTGETNVITISKPPIQKRWFPVGYGPILKLPIAHQDEVTSRYDPPPIREKIFQFSSNTLTKIKARANAECGTTKISTLQALSAHLWRCVTRARGLAPDQQTSCRLSINNRTRLDPPLPENYFGNCMQIVQATVNAEDLLKNSLGWAAMLLHQAVISHNHEKVCNHVESWMSAPFAYQLRGQLLFNPNVTIAGSPRFDMYGNEFGLGKALAVRSGSANKINGKVSVLQGAVGGSSMALGVGLLPDSMSALESDPEFMDNVSSI